MTDNMALNLDLQIKMLNQIQMLRILLRSALVVLDMSELEEFDEGGVAREQLIIEIRKALKLGEE